jgi:hypothetical protein
MKLTSLTIAATLMLGAALSPTVAKTGVKAGVLKCDVEGGVGLIFGSQKNMTCRYSPADGGSDEVYRGTVTKLGLDIGVTGESFITWVVFAPGKVNRGALAGSYVGASAEVSAGLGVGANALIGGFNKSIALQPLSVEGQTGLNVAVGIGEMELVAAGS